jgi:hypothetical protein
VTVDELVVVLARYQFNGRGGDQVAFRRARANRFHLIEGISGGDDDLQGLALFYIDDEGVSADAIKRGWRPS